MENVAPPLALAFPRWARHLGGVAISIRLFGLPIFVAAVFAASLFVQLGIVFMGEPCNPYLGGPFRAGDEGYALYAQCLAQNWPIGALGSLVASGAFLVAVFGVSIAAAGSVFVRNLAATQRLLAPRLVAFRDWFARGDIGREQLKALTDSLEPFAAGTHPASRALVGARTAVFAGRVCLVAAVVLAGLALLFFAYGSTVDRAFGLSVTVPPAIVTTAVASCSWRVARPLRDRARDSETLARESAEATEMEILAEMNKESRTGRPRSGPRQEGPSFAPFVRRAIPR